MPGLPVATTPLPAESSPLRWRTVGRPGARRRIVGPLRQRRRYRSPRRDPGLRAADRVGPCAWRSESVDTVLVPWARSAADRRRAGRRVVGPRPGARRLNVGPDRGPCRGSAARLASRPRQRGEARFAAEAPRRGLLRGSKRQANTKSQTLSS